MPGCSLRRYPNKLHVAFLCHPRINQLNIHTVEPIAQALPYGPEVFQLPRNEVVAPWESFAVVAAVFMGHADDLANSVVGH
jgi:hypothetical protein